MAEIRHRPSPRTTRLLAAAIATTAATVLLVAMHLAVPVTALAAAVGLVRTAAAVLWILWWNSRVVDRRSIAYSIGYVEGVTRRYPNNDTDDLARVNYLDR